MSKLRAWLDRLIRTASVAAPTDIGTGGPSVNPLGVEVVSEEIREETAPEDEQPGR